MAHNKKWSPDLSQGEGPLYLRLVDAMATAISNGELAIGEKLPPQRQLAWHLELNLSTVTKAFTEAKKRHLISGEVGRGTYILGKSEEAELFQLKAKQNKPGIDLSTHIPACPPQDDDLKNSLMTLMDEQPSLQQYLTYHSSVQLKQIANAAAKWLQQLHFDIQPQHCIATSTAQNALLVTLLASCRNEGSGSDNWVLVDELTFPGMKAVAKQLGLKLFGVAMDHQGIKPGALASAIRSCGAKVLVSDPTLQNPTAISMGSARQKSISKIIEQHQLLFIEEFVIGALAGSTPLSNSIKANSLLISSFAKTTSPGIRFATIAGEHPIINTLKQEAYATTWQLSPLMAAVACQWIHSGVAAKRLRWQQHEIAKRYHLFNSIFYPNRSAKQHTTSPHICLKTNIPAQQAAAKLSTLGVEVVPSALFAVNRRYPEFIRVSLTAAQNRQQLKIALEIIRDSGVVKLR